MARKFVRIDQKLNTQGRVSEHLWSLKYQVEMARKCVRIDQQYTVNTGIMFRFVSMGISTADQIAFSEFDSLPHLGFVPALKKMLGLYRMEVEPSLTLRPIILLCIGFATVFITTRTVSRRSTI